MLFWVLPDSNNKKYISVPGQDYKIPENEDILYEMTVNNKRYEADYFQMNVAEIDTLTLQEEVLKKVLSKYTAEQLEKMSNEERTSIGENFAFDYIIDKMEKLSVWFMIKEEYGKYYILLYYDNGYNQANGEDL